MGLFDNYLLDDEPPAPKTHDDEEEYFTLQDKKLEQEIRKLKISNEIALKNLFEKKLMISIMGEIGQSIQNNFVDQSKRRANQWSNILGIPEKERDIEKLIGDLVKDGIDSVQMDLERLSQDGVFD